MHRSSSQRANRNVCNSFGVSLLCSVLVVTRGGCCWYCCLLAWAHACREFVKLAQALKLKTLSYEGGPGYKVGGEKPGSAGLNNMIESARDPGMKAVVKEHVGTCWQWGWDEYNYFAAQSAYAEYLPSFSV